ncbi:MAG: adenylate/guanylate cyclase domain-containing protein [Gammaproteobacteria bacterium]|nr:adenylate/guanylate cyclase domain-containing protein [Gammaproteobacteria bacterium]
MLQKLYAIFLGLIVVGLSVWMVATPNKIVHQWIRGVDNFIYDQRLISLIAHKSPKGKTTAIAILDIDNKSLVEQGAWPWPRAKFAELINNLHEQGASVIASTIVFSEKSDTTATEYLKKLPSKNIEDAELVTALDRLIYLHEGDELLAEAAAKSNVILGVIFDQSANYFKGLLPPPEIEIANAADLDKLVIPTMTAYLANYPELSLAAKQTGFVTGIVDNDGIIRRAPLLATYKNGIYFSLALQAVRNYQHITSVAAEFVSIGNKQVINKITLDKKNIYTDASGTIIIPYQGYAKFFPYYSATDVLNHRIPPNTLKGKIIFIGTSLPGLSDLRPTPFESLFPNVEIQANIANALLGNFIPHTPSWSKGAEIGLIILFGVLLAIVLPFMRAVSLAITLIVVIPFLIYAHFWLWSTKGLIFSFSIPLLTVLLLVTINLISGFLFESRRLDFLFKTFSKYVPPEYAKKISEHQDHLGFEGEARTVTILFTDIRHFTNIAENLDDMELKNFLNQLFTPLTEIILKHKGTIDKYVGDMIMAYWGAPGEDPLHKQHALESALAMQEKTHSLQAKFKQLNLPVVRIGIGINTGEVNIGEIGTDIRRSYTVIGDAVNLASRLEELSKKYRVKAIVGENTYADSDNLFLFRFLDRITVKGKRKPINIYELICQKDQAAEALIEELKKHEEALDYYYTQEWEVAFSLFSKLVEHYPHVKVYSIFLSRIREYLVSPPPENWDGTFVAM